MKPQHQRSQVFIDRPIQGALLLRAVVYWAVCLLTQQLIVFLFVLVTSSADNFHANGAQVWWHIQLSILAALAILPMMLLDILKLSHRWVGPIFRLRAALHALTLGEPVPPIRFREGDFWQDLARDINVVTAELNRHRADQPKENLATESLPSTNAHEACCASHQESGIKAYSNDVDVPHSIPTAAG